MKLTPAQKRALIRSIHNGVLCRLIEMGAVVPSMDGLIDGFSQSFVVAQ